MRKTANKISIKFYGDFNILSEFVFHRPAPLTLSLHACMNNILNTVKILTHM